MFVGMPEPHCPKLSKVKGAGYLWGNGFMWIKNGSY